MLKGDFDFLLRQTTRIASRKIVRIVMCDIAIAVAPQSKLKLSILLFQSAQLVSNLSHNVSCLHIA